MDDEKLEQKIDGLKEFEEKVIENYRKFFNTCEISQIDVHQPESGQSAKETIWSKPGKSEYQANALKYYEKWFSQAEILVKNYYRTRLDELRQLSEDFRKRISLRKNAPLNLSQTISIQNANFYEQVAIVESIPARKKTSSLRFRKEVKQDLAESEVTRAKRLLDEGQLRAAGVLGGVSLERHLKTLIQEISEDEETNQNIKGLAQYLRNKSVITEDKKTHLSHLSDLRNTCAHAEEDLPDERDVERMLNDIDDFIRDY